MHSGLPGFAAAGRCGIMSISGKGGTSRRTRCLVLPNRPTIGSVFNGACDRIWPRPAVSAGTQNRKSVIAGNRAEREPAVAAGKSGDDEGDVGLTWSAPDSQPNSLLDAPRPNWEGWRKEQVATSYIGTTISVASKEKCSKEVDAADKRRRIQTKVMAVPSPVSP